MGAAPDVRSLVRVARRSLFAVRWTESALVAVAAAALAAGAAAFDGAVAARWELAPVALLAALAGGGAHALAHRVSARDVARLVDGRLDLRGALVTAWDREGAGAAGPLDPLLCERVLRSVSPRHARRAVAPSSMLPIAAPFLACAFLAWAGEARRERFAEDLGRLVDGLAEELAAAPAGEAPAGDLARRALEREVRALRTALGDETPDPSEIEAELAALERALDDWAAQAAEPGAAAAAERARAWTDAARRRLAAETPAADRDRGDPPGDRPSSPSAEDPLAEDASTEDSGAAGAPGTGAGEASGAGGEEAPGSGEAPLERAPDAGGGAPAGGSERAGGVPRWWPERHAPLVRAWLERRRASIEDARR